MISEYGQVIEGLLAASAGSYLQTVRYESKHGLLCSMCGGFKNPAYDECRSCEMITNQAVSAGIEDNLADRVACSVYAAEPSSQTLKMMYGYKEEHPISPDYRRNVRTLIALALIGHEQCLNELSCVPVSGWAIVPSTKSSPRYNRSHPLRDIVSALLPGIPEIHLVSNQAKKRFLDPNAFGLLDMADRRFLSGNVLLIDDSWVTGSTLQSAAVRLKLEGAVQVSAYCVARIANTSYLDKLDADYTKLFYRSVRYVRGYCPWHRKIELV